jgi:hypothetical protein
VVDDELAASLEQFEEARLAVRPVEDVVLFDSDHWQPASFRGQRVMRPCRGLLFDKQLISRLLPLCACDDPRQVSEFFGFHAHDAEFGLGELS